MVKNELKLFNYTKMLLLEVGVGIQFDPSEKKFPEDRFMKIGDFHKSRSY